MSLFTGNSKAFMRGDMPVQERHDGEGFLEIRVDVLEVVHRAAERG